MLKRTATLLVLLYSITSWSQHACADFKNEWAKMAMSTPNKDHSALSDTFDISHTHLDLDFSQLPTNFLTARADLSVEMLTSTQKFWFELDGYTVDSAKINGTSVVHQVSGDFRYLAIPSGTWMVGNAALVEIYYSGAAPADPSGWGGWHHSSPYFFNLGVGFDVNPHSYGRSLFPAFDNFIEHSTYSFDITTVTPRKAYANGVRTHTSVVAGDTIIQSWDCSNPLPAYLVSVAISNYEELEDTLTIQSGTIPSLLLARPNDTANVKSSFRNLQGILTSFEDHFGPYVWDKVGYAMTTQGAMEHSTSIHLPLSLANGTLMGEDIIAHELAHHWWGNLITCEKAEDMWINEGMAEFSSHLYQEDVYDRERYMRTVRGNQLQVLNYAHAQDGGYLALNGVDHSTTYGMHVYNKGAWVGHNLRGYLGDSLYTYTVDQIFTNHAHENFTTASFEQVLSQYSGVNMSDFFADQVLQPGQVAVSASIVNVTFTGGQAHADIDLLQNRKERNAYLLDAPMLLKVYMVNDTLEQMVNVNSDSIRITLNGLPSAPLYATINEGEDYLTGTTFDKIEGDGYGIFNLDNAKARLIVNNSDDPYNLYIEHHWAGPEGGSAAARLSTSRFWTIQGDIPNMDAEMRIFFDARPQSGALDADLVSNTEDSLGVYYRANSSEPWSGFPFYTVNHMGSTTDGFGNVTLTKLVPGEYVFANTASVGLEEEAMKTNGMIVYPNPGDDQIILELLAETSDSALVEIINTEGKTVFSNVFSTNNGWNTIHINTSDFAIGTYIVKTKMGEKRVLIAH